MGIDVLVIIHDECIFNLKVRKDVEKFKSKFKKDKVYYVSCDEPLDKFPKNRDGEDIPSIQDIRRIYLGGMLKNVCVKKHAEFLVGMGYADKIYYLEQAIQ